MVPVLLTSTSLEAATGASAVTLTSGLDNTQTPGRRLYALGCNQDIWFAQGIADTTFTANSGTGVFTAANHGLVTGWAVMVKNSGGALPTGLSAATVYWVIVLDTNTYKLATSRANALAGTALSISDNGTGTQTATTTASAGSGSTFLPAGALILLDGSNGAAVSVIQDSAAGKASITQVATVR